MPKISELPAATTATGAEQISAVQSGVTKRLTLAQIGNFTGTGFYNVKSYGAVGDGVTNDTPAIQAAIDAAGAAGGGIIFFPPATYAIWGTSLANGYALGLYWNDITLMGSGIFQTKLLVRNYDGSASDTVPPPLYLGAVRRTAAMFVVGSFRIKVCGMEVDGGAGKTNNRTNPADPVTGDGWDSTHQCLKLQADVALDDIYAEDCWFHSFRGEIIYYGGLDLERLWVKNCKIGDTNADGISASSADLLVEGCEIYNCYNAGSESVYYEGHNVYRNNYIYGCMFGGIQAFTASLNHGTPGFTEIYDNIIENCGANYHPGARNLRVFNNLFIDCVAHCMNLTSPGPGGDGSEEIEADNVEIFNNTMVANTAGVVTDCFLSIGTTAANPPRNIHVHHNAGYVSRRGVSNGAIINAGIRINTLGSGNWGAGSRIYANEFGTGADDTRFRIAKNQTFSDNVNRSICYVKAEIDYFARIFVSWKVITASTVVRVQVVWDSPAGQQTQIVTDQSYAVGNYSAFFQCRNYGVVASGRIDVHGRVATGANVTMDAEIDIKQATTDFSATGTAG